MSVVLLIDDDRDFLEMLRITLEREGYVVQATENGNEGLEAARDQPVDLVVTDIFMPESEGIETIIELRREFPDVGIIAISGGGSPFGSYVFDLAKTLGARRTFRKPLDMPLFLDAVRELVGRVAMP